MYVKTLGLYRMNIPCEALKIRLSILLKYKDLILLDMPLFSPALRTKQEKYAKQARPSFPSDLRIFTSLPIRYEDGNTAARVNKKVIASQRS